MKAIVDVGKFRQQRFLLFKTLIASLPRPLNILDVGGTKRFWEKTGFVEDGVNITLLNVREYEVGHPNFRSVTGDATNLKEFDDGQFDVVFSNSVIEHVGGLDQQFRMAQEVRRVGKRYFVQTPNRYFPIEPHFLLPLFQFVPLQARLFLVRELRFGWRHRIHDKETAGEFVSAIRLVSEGELKKMFPGAQIYKERALGLVKSFVVYDGWERVLNSLN